MLSTGSNDKSMDFTNKDKNIENDEKVDNRKGVLYRTNLGVNTDDTLPINNIGRIMKLSIPENGKISRESKVLMQKLSREFICSISLYAGEICTYNKRKVINGEDIINALSYFGYDEYKFVLLDYLEKWGGIKNSKNSRIINNSTLYTECGYSGTNGHNETAYKDDRTIRDYSQTKNNIYINNIVDCTGTGNVTLNTTPSFSTRNSSFKCEFSNNNLSLGGYPVYAADECIINEYGKRNKYFVSESSIELTRNRRIELYNRNDSSGISVYKSVDDNNDVDSMNSFNHTNCGVISTTHPTLFGPSDSKNRSNFVKQDKPKNHNNGNFINLSDKFTCGLSNECNKEDLVYCYLK